MRRLASMGLHIAFRRRGIVTKGAPPPLAARPPKNSPKAPFVKVTATDETLAERLRPNVLKTTSSSGGGDAGSSAFAASPTTTASAAATARNDAVGDRPAAAAAGRGKYADEAAPQPKEIRVRRNRTVLTIEWEGGEELNAGGRADAATVMEGFLTLPCTTAGGVRPHPPTALTAELLRVCAPSTDVKGSPHLVVGGKRGLKVKDLYPVGNYALRVVFSDGHDAGIYPYGYLMHLGKNWVGEARRYLAALKAARRSRNPPAASAAAGGGRTRPTQAASKAHEADAAFAGSPGALIGHPPPQHRSCSDGRDRG